MSPEVQTPDSNLKHQALAVDLSNLTKLGNPISLVEYLVALWKRRHFIKADASARAFKSNRDYRLGMLWVILEPLLNALMYGLIFGVLLQTSRGIENFIGFLILGSTYFTFMNKLLMGGSGLLKSQKNMISSFDFPIASLVISHSLYRFFEYIPAALVAVIVAIVFQWDKGISWTVLCVPVLFLLIHVFGTGLMFITARLSAFIPDLKVILGFISRAWFYTSGIFFTLDRFSTFPEIQRVMELNPAYIFLQAVRGSAIYGEFPTLSVWLTLLAWASGTFLVGIVFFWRAEERYVRIF